MPAEPIALLERLKPLLNELGAVLEVRDAERFTGSSLRKDALAAELSRVQAEPPAVFTGFTEAEPVHSSVRSLLAECHHQNLVNGRIVRRSQQSIRELARILTGHEAEPLYDARGSRRPSPYGTAITEA